jgi:hypothetical protein
MIRNFINWDYYVEHDPEWAQGVLLRQRSGSFTSSTYFLASFVFQHQFAKATLTKTDHCLSMLLEVLHSTRTQHL